VRDVWKSALEWYIYFSDRQKKMKYAMVIMGVKDQLGEVKTKGELAQHYMANDGLADSVLRRLFPRDEWMDLKATEDVAYGLRCLELSTGKRFNLMRHQPSRWLIETVA
jgi:hypothetical protein